MSDSCQLLAKIVAMDIVNKHKSWRIYISDEQKKAIEQATIFILEKSPLQARQAITEAFPVYVEGTKIPSLVGYNILTEMIPNRIGNLRCKE